MSLKAVVEIVLRVESYYIFEYPHQGLFSFHCTLYQLKEGVKVRPVLGSTSQFLTKYSPTSTPNLSKTSTG
jgi:hypothetical protein